MAAAEVVVAAVVVVVAVVGINTTIAWRSRSSNSSNQQQRQQHVWKAYVSCWSVYASRVPIVTTLMRPVLPVLIVRAVMMIPMPSLLL